MADPDLRAALAYQAGLDDGRAEHRYLSTACLHGRHDYCAGAARLDGGTKAPARCKWCQAACVCDCHGGGQ